MQKKLQKLRREILKPISNENGLTLLEMMIAGAIAFGLAMAIATMISTTTKQEQTIRLKQEAFNYQQQNRYERKTQAPPIPD